MLAVGALRAAADRGFRVPQDIAIVGFDNTEHSVYNVPSITTIAPDKIALAQAAVDLIHARAGSTEPFDPEDVQIPFSLEIRESTTTE
jgi:DNA-binding LacI/PurR family transcriptional regulator